MCPLQPEGVGEVREERSAMALPHRKGLRDLADGSRVRLYQAAVAQAGIDGRRCGQAMVGLASQGFLILAFRVSGPEQTPKFAEVADFPFDSAFFESSLEIH